MKLLIKLALVGLAAKALVASPKGQNKELDRVGDMTVRQVAHEVDNALIQMQKKIGKILS